MLNNLTTTDANTSSCDSRIAVDHPFRDGHAIDPELIVERQTLFYQKNGAGCLFAALAAKNPMKYGWSQRVIWDHRPQTIDSEIHLAIEDPNVNIVSLILPSVETSEELAVLIQSLQECSLVFLERDIGFENTRCLGFRARIGNLTSWITGFGPFDFFPVTRQSPYTEITLRVKPRPAFKWVMKESPPHVIHLADLDMLGIADALFKKLWYSTFTRVEELLGHKPNTKSQAKTTFTIPETL